jgi:hypothetical protein
MVPGVPDEERNGSDVVQKRQNITRRASVVSILVSFHKKMGSSEFQKGLHHFFFSF